MSIIDVENLSFKYDNKELILQNVDFSIYKNQFITIVGPNGGGKSTLLKLLIGLISPTKGKIKVKSKNIGYIPQYSIFDTSFPVTVKDIILMGVVKKIGFYNKRDYQNLKRVLQIVKMEDKIDKSFSDLSGGQKQRILIARALISHPSILLMDEPTASIDPYSEKQLYNLLLELKKSITILFVTHNTNFVNNITDRVFCVNKFLVEHPVQELQGNNIAKYFNNNLKIVRHDISLNKGDIVD